MSGAFLPCVRLAGKQLAISQPVELVAFDCLVQLFKQGRTCSPGRADPGVKHLLCNSRILTLIY